jgi:hypothetical protein
MFAPSRLRLPSAAASGTPALRTPTGEGGGGELRRSAIWDCQDERHGHHGDWRAVLSLPGALQGRKVRRQVRCAMRSQQKLSQKPQKRGEPQPI